MSKHVKGRREAVLAFVTEYHAEHGMPPTAREVETALGIAVGVVHYHLRQLARDHLLRHERGKYLPVSTRVLGELPLPRPIASCPWGEVAHDYAESLQTPLLFCRKCGGTLPLKAPTYELGVVS